MELLKIRVFIIILLTINTMSCQERENSFDSFEELKSSHTLKDGNVKEFVNTYLKKNEDYKDYNSNVGILLVDGDTICITLVNYKKFRKYRGDFFDQVAGYLDINEIPFLLFGEIESITTIKRGAAVNSNLLGSITVFDKDTPPIIYEPNFECM